MSCPNKNFLYHVSKLRCVRIRVSVSMLHINKPILSLCLQDKDTSGLICFKYFNGFTAKTFNFLHKK